MMDILYGGGGGGGPRSSPIWNPAPWNKPERKTERVPTDSDVCRCGHTYAEHKTVAGACGYRESVFSDIARSGPSGPQCECAIFNFRYGTDMARLEKVMKDIMALTLAKQDVTLQDLENILRPVLAGSVTVEKQIVYVREPAPKPEAEPVQKVLERVFVLKPALEGRAAFNLDEEV